MSPHTRTRHQTQANLASPPMATTNSGDGIVKAKEAIYSLDRFNDPWERFREVWQDLRQAYEDTVNNSDSDTCRPFPIWALSQFDPGYLESLLTVGYYQDLGHLKTWASTAALKFKVRPWQFILFFDYIEQARARAINKISKERPDLTFNQLYEEVQNSRLNRIKHQKNPRYDFLPRDFKACLKENDNEDGSDAELNDGFDDAEENEAEDEEGNGDGNPENSHRAPIDNSVLNSHEGECTAGNDEEEDLAELSDIIYNAPRRSVRPSTSTLPIIIPDEADERDADGEIVTPITMSPQVENVARRREPSGEQSSSLDPLSGEGNSASIKGKLHQHDQSISLKLEGLKAEIKEASETAENLVQRLKEENAAYVEKAKQVLMNPNASPKDMQSAMDRIIYKLGNNNKKRKIEEEDNEKRERLAVKLENPEFQAFFKTDARQPEAASANIRRQRASQNSLGNNLDRAT